MIFGHPASEYFSKTSHIIIGSHHVILSKNAMSFSNAESSHRFSLISWIAESCLKSVEEISFKLPSWQWLVGKSVLGTLWRFFQIVGSHLKLDSVEKRKWMCGGNPFLIVLRQSLCVLRRFCAFLHRGRRRSSNLYDSFHFHIISHFSGWRKDIIPNFLPGKI